MNKFNGIITSKLPGVETSIFAVMSGLAIKHKAINLSQGFPDFDCPKLLLEETQKALTSQHDQYAPMAGALSLREEIAKKTLDCLKKNVPSEVPGIAFLSGGQSEIDSSKNLNEINKINDTNFLITFSYGRGLQASALKEFGKNQENFENIQKAFNHRAKMNGLSSKGEWSEDLEKESAA